MRAQVILLGICLASSLLCARAEDKKEQKRQARGVSEEQKKIRNELRAKYDENKNGKLEPEERTKISAEDKQRIKETRKQIKKDKTSKAAESEK